MKYAKDHWKIWKQETAFGFTDKLCIVSLAIPKLEVRCKMYYTEHQKKMDVGNFVQVTSTYYNAAIAFAYFCVIKPFKSISFSKAGLLMMISNPRLQTQ